ncbi:MAG: glycerophosphodiester phosphodiesterase family protein [Pseudomonadota bacterium]
MAPHQISLEQLAKPLDRSQFVRPIAHRGLHDHAATIVENTGPAFKAAIRSGFGIECDVRAAAGGRPIIFHDATTDRLTNRQGDTATLTERDLETVAHAGSGAPILTLSAGLKLVAGRAPILVEVKSMWNRTAIQPDDSFIAQLCSALVAYEGPAAVMSFDPDILAAIKAREPQIPRGLVATGYVDTMPLPKNLTAKRAKALAELEDAPRVKPSFVAYNVNDLPTPQTQHLRAMGYPVFAWTVRTDQQRTKASTYADAAIFERELQTRVAPGESQQR